MAETKGGGRATGYWRLVTGADGSGVFLLAAVADLTWARPTPPPTRGAATCISKGLITGKYTEISLF